MRKTKWEKEQERVDAEARRSAHLAKLSVQYFIAQGRNEVPRCAGSETEYRSLPEVLDAWMSCYFLGNTECFIRFTDADGRVYEIPIPLVDDHDFEWNYYDLPHEEIARLRKATVFWKEVDRLKGD